MATRKLCVASVLLWLHAANSYILLTANLEDVHTIAKQIAASPVANQLNQIIRRASSIFNQHSKGGNQIHQRADDNIDQDKDNDKNFDIWKPDPKKVVETLQARSTDTEGSDGSAEKTDQKENKVERRNSGNPDLAELGRNASFYLKSIKKIFESV